MQPSWYTTRYFVLLAAVSVIHTFLLQITERLRDTKSHLDKAKSDLKKVKSELNSEKSLRTGYENITRDLRKRNVEMEEHGRQLRARLQHTESQHQAVRFQLDQRNQDIRTSVHDSENMIREITIQLEASELKQREAMELLHISQVRSCF